MAVWPLGLPQYLSPNSYSERTASGTAITQMDAGPPKFRNRYTAVPTFISGTMLLSSAQVTILKDDFYRDTLSNGSLRFTWVHPRTQAAATMSFLGEPQISAVGPVLFQATLQLMIWP